MFRTLPTSARVRLPVGLVVSVVAFVSPAVASAQSPRGPYIPPDVKGYQALMMRQSYFQQAASLAGPSLAPTTASRHSTVNVPTDSPPAEVHIAINLPGNWNPPASLAIREPSGEVRTFSVEGGQAALRSHVIVVRPGESVTVQLTRAP